MSSSPNLNWADVLRKFRFEKKISLKKCEEGKLENGCSGISDLKVSGGGDFTAISSILDMKKKVNRILSDSESDLSDGPVLNTRKRVTNGIKSDNEEDNDVKVNGTKSTENGGKSKLNGNGIKDDDSDEEVNGKEDHEKEDDFSSSREETNDEKPDKTSPKKQTKKRPKKTYHVDLDGEVIIGGQTVEEKALMALIDKCPDQDPITLQDLLLRCHWNVEEAAERAKRESMKCTISPTKKKGHGKRRRIDESDGEDSDSADDDADNDGVSKRRKVYDSDADSDEDSEVPNEISSKEKAEVFEFFSTAKVAELQLMQGCSKKKADIICSLRPFTNWDDLMAKLESTSQISEEFLNKAQEVLATRQTVEKLIKQCLVLSHKLEKAVATELNNVIKQPELLSKHLTLSDYQLIGLNWLTIMHRNQVNAILADEMGLGKTIQIIAFLAWLKEHNFNKPGCPHLIVVPAATLENWNNEIARWCPTMNVDLYHGSQDERRYLRGGWSKGGFGDTDVILTTYNTISSTHEEKKFFCKKQLQYAIFDEAHMLKNMATKRYVNLINIKALGRVLLTGTPLQNNLLELMSLCVFVMPKLFGGKQKDLESFFTKTAASREGPSEDLPEFERKQISLARDIIKPFVLRRLKDDVLKHLPTKSGHVRCCPMLPDQQDRYNQLIADFTKQAKSAMGEDEEFRDSGMAMYMKLRRLANHPLLLRYLYEEEDIQKFAKALSIDMDYKDTVVEYIVDDLAFMSDFEIHQLSKKYVSCRGWGLKSEDIVKSGKFAALDELLPKLKEDGHRVLFFSQFLIVLDIVEEYMQIRGHKYMRLDGSTPVSIRQEMIDEYNKDHSIFLFMISTRAGGLGINLTSADTVIIHDIDSNPHNDKQAEDRSHRIGQTRPVTVIRLVSKGTIEENIHQMGLEKLKLEKEISNTEDNESSEKRSVASLLRQVLGLDKNKAHVKSCES